MKHRLVRLSYNPATRREPEGIARRNAGIYHPKQMRTISLRLPDDFQREAKERHVTKSVLVRRSLKAALRGAASCFDPPPKLSVALACRLTPTQQVEDSRAIEAVPTCPPPACTGAAGHPRLAGRNSRDFRQRCQLERSVPQAEDKDSSREHPALCAYIALAGHSASKCGIHRQGRTQRGIR